MTTDRPLSIYEVYKQVANKIHSGDALSHVIAARAKKPEWLQGEQRNVNHLNCPAGNDTKERLYIKRTEYGYVGYCHHCQGSFVMKDAHADEEYIRNILFRPEETIVASERRRHLTDFSFGSVSVQGMDWLFKYLSTDVIYSMHRAKLLAGVAGENNLLVVRVLGMEENSTTAVFDKGIIRNVAPHARLKTLSYTGNQHGSYCYSLIGPSPVIVLVEDVVSKYKVVYALREARISALVVSLNGCSLHYEIEDELREYLMVNDYSEPTFVLMLDPDDAGIVATRSIEERLEFLYHNSVIKTPELTPVEIREAVTNV